jgi:triphosphatase
LQHRATTPSGAAAKASRYPTFAPETPVRAAARVILRTLLAAIVQEAPAVLRGDDVRATHDMRVAIRRLRSAMDTFEAHFPGKRLRRFARETRRLGRRLGAVRDGDVHLAALHAALATASAQERDGIAFAIEAIAELRRQHLERFEAAFTQFELAGLERMIADE